MYLNENLVEYHRLGVARSEWLDTLDCMWVFDQDLSSYQNNKYLRLGWEFGNFIFPMWFLANAWPTIIIVIHWYYNICLRIILNFQTSIHPFSFSSFHFNGYINSTVHRCLHFNRFTKCFTHDSICWCAYSIVFIGYMVGVWCMQCVPVNLC